MDTKLSLSPESSKAEALANQLKTLTNNVTQSDKGGSPEPDKAANAVVLRLFPNSREPLRKVDNHENTKGQKNHAFVSETYMTLKTLFPRIFYNTLKNDLFYYDDSGRQKNFTENDFNTVLIDAKQSYGKGITEGVLNALLNSQYIQRLNPVLEWYEKHKSATKQPQLIDELISTIETDTHHFHELFKVWLCGFGALLAQDTIPPRLGLVLCGKQNTGKTTFLRELLPPELNKEYFAESDLSKGKDDEALLCQNLLVVNDEFRKDNLNDDAKMKSIISKKDFYFRVPYGRKNQQFKKTAQFAATCNPLDFVTDLTGNTRFIPCHVLNIDHQKYNAIDKTALFIEILRLYESGAPYVLNADQIEKLEKISERHTVINTADELLPRHFDPITKIEYERQQGDNVHLALTATEIHSILKDNHRHTPLTVENVGRMLAKSYDSAENYRVKEKRKRKVYFVKIIKTYGNVIESPFNNN